MTNTKITSDNAKDTKNSIQEPIELMMRTNNYLEADNVLSKIEYELDTETLQEIQQEIILRKRVFERQN